MLNRYIYESLVSGKDEIKSNEFSSNVFIEDAIKKQMELKGLLWDKVKQFFKK